MRKFAHTWGTEKKFGIRQRGIQIRKIIWKGKKGSFLKSHCRVRTTYGGDCDAEWGSSCLTALYKEVGSTSEGESHQWDQIRKHHLSKGREGGMGHGGEDVRDSGVVLKDGGRARPRFPRGKTTQGVSEKPPLGKCRRSGSVERELGKSK